MTEYYTINEMYGEKFYQVPKVFFTNPLYKEGLSPLEKMAFGLLKDRFTLSVKNGWYDSKGRIYFIFTQENLMEIFDCSKQTASNIKKNLVKVGLLEVKRNGQGNADWLYLKKPIVTDDDIYLIDKVESLGAVEKSKKQTSKSLKNGRLEVSKIDANDTDFNKTDFNNLEEEEKTSHSKLVSFLLSKDITLENALLFENRLLEEQLTGFTYDDVIKAIEDSLNDFLDGFCNEPYVWAVGKLKRLLDGKIKAVKDKPKQRKGKTKIVRTEKMPEHMKDYYVAPTPTEEEKARKKAQRQEIEEMLKKLRS
jgi:Replication initiator protein A (RepA) N-terminus